MNNYEESISAYIADNILFTKAYPHEMDASFLEHGIVDSMNILELVMFLEEKFGVHVQDDEIVPTNFDSVSKMAEYVQRKVAKQEEQ